MKQLIVLALVGVLSLTCAALSQSQGVLEYLQELETRKPSPPTTSSPPDRAAICKELEAQPSPVPKCRSYYLSNGYRIAWWGEIRGCSHPPTAEVLVKEDSAVLCVIAFRGDSDADTFPCWPMKKH